MAHEITASDNLFVVRTPAWHGLGNVLESYPTRAEAQAIAHPWEPVSEPFYRKVAKVTETSLGPITTYDFVEVEDHTLVVRDDNADILATRPVTREIVSNATLYDIAEAIEGEAHGSVRYETGGSLAGGKKVWLLLALNEPIVIPGDPSPAIPYFALQNAHDGSGSFRGQALQTRIVCANTSRAADFEAKARGTEFAFRHSAGIHDRIAEAKDALATWRADLDKTVEAAAFLNTLQVTDAQALDFISLFIPEPTGEVVSDRVRHNVSVARRQVAEILQSETCDGIRNTAWGLVSASVEYLDHVRRANTSESRLNRTLLTNDRLKYGATEIALAVAGH